MTRILEDNSSPRSWAWCSIGDIGEVITGTTPSKKVYRYYGNDFPFYKPADLDRGFIISSSEDGLSKEGAKVARLLPETTVLVTCIGKIGKVSITSVKAASNQQINAIVPISETVSSKYLGYVLLSPAIQNEMRINASATILPILNKSKFEKIRIPICSMNEQKRIISKIEEIFTRLDVGIDSLKKAKIQLKRYRQSVLKAAFEGKLTEEWRKHNTNEIESNSILLANIRKHGKSLDTDSNHMDNDIVLGTTSYPARWPLANLPEIGELKRGMSKHRPRDDKMLYGGPYPFIQTGDIRNSKGIIKNFTQTYSELGLKQSKLWPEGTLCITIAANIAETAILGIEACFPDSIVGFVPNRTICNAKFIHFFIQSIKRKLESYAPATAQKNINVGILSRLPVPIPCLLEQEQIVGLLEDQFSIIDNLAVTIDQTLNGATILRQSVLTEAFRGKLISQDPNDEPAGKLLEMIREEKSKLAEQTILQVQPGSGGK